MREKSFKKYSAFLNTQSFIHPGLVHWPMYLNPKILPHEMKVKITESFKALKAELNEPFDKFDGIVAFMNSEDLSAKQPLFKEYCRSLDAVRGTDRFKVFPELRGLF